jgi:hypothetical protein
VPTTGTVPADKAARDAHIARLCARSDALVDRSNDLTVWTRAAVRRADVAAQRLRNLERPGRP